MTRTERLLRLARQRGDRAAIAILESDVCPTCGARTLRGSMTTHLWMMHPPTPELDIRKWTASWTEAELRAVWGDR